MLPVPLQIPANKTLKAAIVGLSIATLLRARHFFEIVTEYWQLVGKHKKTFRNRLKIDTG